MIVRELIKLLQKEDQDAVVGTAFSGNDGYVTQLLDVKHATDDDGNFIAVVLDQDRDMISPDELNIG